jgi:hypothetical protein
VLKEDLGKEMFNPKKNLTPTQEDINKQFAVNFDLLKEFDKHKVVSMSLNYMSR